MKFSREQTEFLEKELGIHFEPNINTNLSKEKWLDIRDEIFLIEAEEARADGVLTDRCRIAVELIDMQFD